jgi:uncharacterized membrane protein
MRKTIAKAVTWRLIGTSEIFAISFWTTVHIETAGHTAVIAAVASFLSYIVHELVWNGSISRDRVVECGEAIVIRVIKFSTQIIDLITREVDTPPDRLRDTLAARYRGELQKCVPCDPYGNAASAALEKPGPRGGR